MTEIPIDTSSTAASGAEVDAITIRLGPIAAQALSASGQVRPERLERTLVQAIAYYLGPAKESPGWAFPKFLVADSEPAGRVTVDLDEVAWNKISAEAARQRVEPDALIQHVALFFGAARDAGQLTDRIVEDLDREPFGSTRGSTV